MLTSILRFETKRLLAGGTAPLTAVLLLALIGYAGYVGTQHVADQRGVQDSYLSRHAERIETVRERLVEAEAEAVRNGALLDAPVGFGMRHPYVMGSAQGEVVTLEPAPLAAFAVGQSDLQPAGVRVTMGGQQPLGGAAALDNPLKLLVGSFDLAFVFVFLFPLLILALTFGLTSAERESGLLRMVLAQPVRLATLAAGKITIRALLLLACAVLGTGAVLILDGLDGGVGQWLLWLLVTVLYGGFWMALAAFVDSRVRRPVTGGFVLAACWLTLVVLAPALINSIASTLYPVPSRMDYVSTRRAAASLAEQEGAASLAKYFNDHPELASVDADEADYAMRRVAQDERIAEALAPIDRQFADQKARQQRFIESLGYLSPAILAQLAFLDIAGTGHARYAAFDASVEVFQKTWSEHFAPSYFTRRPLRPADLDALPTLTFQDEPASQVLMRLAGPLLALVLLSLVFALGAQHGYGRPNAAL